jgi:hypothetical protein
VIELKDSLVPTKGVIRKNAKQFSEHHAQEKEAKAP